MHGFKFLTTVIITSCAFWTSHAAAQYGGGAGTAEDPYQIWTAEQMNAVGANPNHWDKYFKLMANVDLSDYDRHEGRPAFNTIGYAYDYETGFQGKAFSGTFDGNGKKISNLTLFNERNENIYLGLFPYVVGEDALIKDLELINPKVQATTTGNTTVGALVGAMWQGTVTNCRVVQGIVSGHTSGGIIGRIEYGTTGEISSCYSHAFVTGHRSVGGLVGNNRTGGAVLGCSAHGVVEDTDKYYPDNYQEYGGLVGNNRGLISDCYATTNVFAQNAVGGLVGINYGYIYNCYARGNVIANNSSGGLVGFNVGLIYHCYSTGSAIDNYHLAGGLVGTNYRTTAIISDCFWDKESSGRSKMCASILEGAIGCDNACGKTTAQMQQESTFTDYGWDFSSPVWTICQGYDYPKLYVNQGEIQKAIWATDDGDTVIIPPGLYYENICFGGKNITLRSEDPNNPDVVAKTIIHGQGIGEVVTFTGTESPDCTLRGFTITGGYNIDESGGGIQGHGTQATICQCIIKDNFTYSAGGGIHNCHGLISKCVFIGNVGTWGGGPAKCNGVISNCLIVGNSAEYGSGLNNCDGKIINCTIAENTASEEGTLRYCDAEITNCVIWNNSPGSFYICSLPTYSCFVGGSIGTGNIDANPLFANEAIGDYRLLPGSPCLDAGCDAGVYKDIEGNVRPWDCPWADNNGEQPEFDMGAYEFTALQTRLNLTPRALNLESKGKWFKAHMVMPDGFSLETIDANTPALLETLSIESEYINAFVNEDNLVELEIAFNRADLCGVGDFGPGEVAVVGRLSSGQYFYGTDQIKIVHDQLGTLLAVVTHWLAEDCAKPKWCAGADINQDGQVNLVDYALLDGCCVEVMGQ